MCPLPRSLFARTACLIAALLLAGQLGTYVFFGVYRPSPKGPVEEALAGTIRMALYTLRTTPAERRPAVLAELDGLGTLRFVRRLEPSVRLHAPQTPVDRVLAQAVAQAVDPVAGARVFLDADHPRDRLWLRLPPGYGFDWLYVRRPPPPRYLPGPYTHYAKIAVLLGLTLLGGLLIALHVSLPLRQLAFAARELSRGRAPPLIEERGPGEVRVVIKAFNQTSAALKRVEDDRGLMLAGLSHDLRTPLTRLRLCLELLSERMDDTLRRRFLRDLNEIDDIVDQFSAYVAGARIDPQPDVDLQPLVADLADALRRPGVDIEVRLEALPPLTLDRIAIRRALSNLLENSIKYGASSVVVNGGCAGDGAWIEVLDDGPGIPESEIAAAMRPFVRLDPSRNQVGGSGLGLAIVDRIAQQHGGRLRLERREQGGLRAVLSLPCSGGGP